MIINEKEQLIEKFTQDYELIKTQLNLTERSYETYKLSQNEYE